MQEQDEVKETKRNKLLLAIIAILLIIIVAITIFYVRSTHPRTQAKKEATTIAKEYAQLTTVDEFYWFTRKATYFSVTGTNDKGDQLAVIIPKKGGKITVLNQKDGKTEDQIRQIIANTYQESDIQKVSLGMYEDKPAWEVVTKNAEGALNYYLLSFDMGTEMLVIKNV